MGEEWSTTDRVIRSSVAGGVAETIVMPICVWMTYRATNDSKVSSTWQLIQNNNKGDSLWKGFYKGWSWQVSTQMLSTGSKFTMYEEFKQHSGLPNRYVNGVLSNLLAVTLTQSFDTIKTNMQLAGNVQLKKDRFWAQVRHSPVTTLYRGYTPALAKGFIGGATFFPIRDTAREYCSSTPLGSVAANSVSAVISTTLVHVVDVWKRRLQNGQQSNFALSSPSYRNTLVPNIARVLLHFNLQMGLIELFLPPKVKKS